MNEETFTTASCSGLTTIYDLCASTKQQHLSCLRSINSLKLLLHLFEKWDQHIWYIPIPEKISLCLSVSLSCLSPPPSPTAFVCIFYVDVNHSAVALSESLFRTPIQPALKQPLRDVIFAARTHPAAFKHTQHKHVISCR
jgi:hypothetical protein